MAEEKAKQTDVDLALCVLSECGFLIQRLSNLEDEMLAYCKDRAIWEDVLKKGEVHFVAKEKDTDKRGG